MANKTFKVTSGVLNAYIADINEGGTYGTPELLCGLVSFSAETGTNETALVQANKVFFTANEIGKTTGSLETYGIVEDMEEKIFAVKKNTNGGKIYTTKANVGYKVLIIERTVLDEATGLEEVQSLYFPKVRLAKTMSENGSTKGEDGTMNASTKSLAFTVIPTDAGVYKVVEAGAHKETITEAIFTPASI